jgi:L-alanine-DL-glutamate epimerase-like enolase superfamily enzyme
MKIKDIKLHVLEIPVKGQRVANRDFRQPLEHVNTPLHVRFVPGGPSPVTTQRINLLRIQTDSGLEGLCTGGTPSAVETLRSELVGQDPLNHGLLWQRLWWSARFKHIHLQKVAPFDNALWDLRAKVADMPLHRLLGTVRQEIPCYLSAPHYPDPQDSIREVKEAKRRGYLGYKFHAYHGLEADLELFREVREAVGPEMYLMQDAVHTYTYPEAVRVGRALERLNFFWLEEPLRDNDLYGLARLCRELEIPVATTETIGEDLQSVAQHIYLGAGDIVRTDTNRAGISTILRIAHLAEAFGMNTELTSMGACFGLANVHAIMSISNTTFYEDWDNQHVLMKALGCKHIMRSEKGYIKPPEANGFGLEPDWNRVKELTVAEY